MASLPVIRIVMKAVDNVTRQTRQINSALRSVSATSAQVGASMTAAFTAPVLLAGHNMFTAAVESSKAFNLMKANIEEGSVSFDELRKSSAAFAEGSLRNVAEVREGMVELGRAGKDTEEVQEMFKGVTNLAIAVDTSSGSSAQTLVNFMNQFQMEAEKTGLAADLMATTVSGSAQGWDDFAASVEHGAAVAKQAGLDEIQFLQMNAMLANMGLRGSRVGAQNKAMMRAMVDPEKFGSAFGVQTQIDGQFRDVLDVYKDVAKVMADMPEAERAAKLMDVFGRIGITGSAALIGNTEAWENMGAMFDDVTGKVDEMAGFMSEDLFGATLKVKNAWGALTEKLLGHEGSMLEAILLKIAATLSKIASLDTATLEALAAAAIAIAASGPALMLISSITGAMAGLPVLGQIISGTAGAFGIGAAATATGAAGTAAGGAEAIAISLKAVGATVSKLAGPIGIIALVVSTFAAGWATIKGVLGAIITWFANISGIKEQFQRISEQWSALGAELKKLWTFLEPVMRILAALVFLPMLITVLSVVLITLKGVAWVLEGVVTLVNGIIGIFRGIMDFFTRGKFTEFVDNQQDHFAGLREFTGSVITDKDIADMSGTNEDEENRIQVVVSDDRVTTTTYGPQLQTTFGGI